MRLQNRPLVWAVSLLLVAAQADAQVTTLFEDNFDAGTSAANYTTVADPDNTAGSTNPNPNLADFAYSYTNLGDNADQRSGIGARFETENALTAFITGLNIDGSTPVRISYDMLLQPRSSGSTEYGFVGVGDGSLPFQNYLSGSLNGTEETQGVFAGALTDADTAGSGDYVILESDGTVKEPTELFNADAAATTQSGVGFENVFPGDPDSSPAWPSSTPGNHWTAVNLTISGNTITYRLDGSVIASVTSSISPTGLVGIGIGDPFPSSNQGSRVPPLPSTAMIIDNVLIEAIPEPASLALVGLAAVVGLARRRRG